jgi:aminopeptidase-like protein
MLARISMSELRASEVSGEQILAVAKKLFPITRSITGEGVRETLRIIQEIVPDLQIKEVPSGTKCFDWTVPQEWQISEAYIENPARERIVDFRNNNLHVVSYSTPVDQTLGLDELQKHLHSLPEMPTAIPYVTSYYVDRWGFCLTHEQRESLRPGQYRAVIKSRKFDGVLNYGELLLKGASQDEIFLSTYVCHPSMANNEISGPSVVTYVAKWLASLDRKYSYRIIFIPETIGAICYLSKNLEQMKSRTFAGFNISCVGDDRTYSIIESRTTDTVADRVAKHVLKHVGAKTKIHTFLERGSDERQYCSPGVDLPVVGLSRTRFASFPEYHTSLDDFSVVTAAGLKGGFDFVTACLAVLEGNQTYLATHLCEPQLGLRGLYPTLGARGVESSVEDLLNVLAYSDGNTDLLQIADTCGIPFAAAHRAAQRLLCENLLRVAD